MLNRAVLRLLDVNANRAIEGLRVSEDISRFYCEDVASFRRLRALRHDVAATTQNLPISPFVLLSARDSRNDPGRRVKAGPVLSLEHLLLINLQRAKESLRVLEECTRYIFPRRTSAFQELRFRLYEVERGVVLRMAAIRNHRSLGSRRARSG